MENYELGAIFVGLMAAKFLIADVLICDFNDFQSEISMGS